MGGPIDRDTLDPQKYPEGEISILIDASLKDQPDTSATLKLLFQLEDSNDETPEFEQDSLTTELNENSEPDGERADLLNEIIE